MVDGMYGVLVEEGDKLDGLETVYTRKPKADEFKEYKEYREDLLMAILSHFNGMTKGKLTSMANELELIEPFVQKHFGKIIADNPAKRTDRINQMFVELDGDAALKAALTTVGLMAYLNELRVQHQGLAVTKTLRSHSVAVRTKMNTKLVKSDVSVALANFLKSVEFGMILHPTIDYAPLVNDINALLVEFKTQFTANLTRNETAAETTAAATAAKAAGTEGVA